MLHTAGRAVPVGRCDGPGLWHQETDQYPHHFGYQVHRAARWKGTRPFTPGGPGLTPGYGGRFFESVCSDRAMLRVHKSLQSSRVPPHSGNTARDACRVALLSGLSCRDSNRHDRLCSRPSSPHSFSRVPRFGGLWTVEIPRRAAAMPAGAMCRTKAPQVGRSNIGVDVFKEPCGSRADTP